MTYLLEDLVIDRVDLVDEGANSASFIELFKRKEKADIMEYEDIIAKMKPEHSEIIQKKIFETQEELAAMIVERDEAKKQLDETTALLKTANDDLDKAKLELDGLKQEEEVSEEDTFKAMPEEARELIAKYKAQKDAAEEELRKAKEIEQHAEAVAKAATLKSLPIEENKLIELIKTSSKEMIDVLTTIAAAMDETVLGEVGKNHANTGDASTSQGVWNQIELKAEEIMKQEKISKAKAISRVVDENPDLYKQYLQGGAN